MNRVARCLSPLLACGLLGAPILAGAAEPEPDLPDLATTAGEQSAEDEPSAVDLEKIAKMTANPIGAAWMLWTQNDYSELRGDLIPGGKRLNSTKFQPVMSFPIDVAGQDWNLILRPVLQYQSVPLDKRAGDLFGTNLDEIIVDPDLRGIAATAFDDRTNGLGDTALLTLLGPDRLDGFIWGAGVTQIFPTAAEDVLGQGKWQAGPASLAARLAPNPGGFNIGALAQHWWSYAGDSDRPATSQTDIQYFINYRLSATELWA